MTSSEHCYYACLMLVVTGSALGIIWSIISIGDANDGIREKELKLYEADELGWNNTYLQQIKSININIIKNGDFYKEQMSEIEKQQSKINSLPNSTSISDLEFETKRLVYLQNGLD